MSLGKKIKELREKNNKTQLEISKFLGVTYQTIYKYEKDIAVPPADAIIKLAEYFNVTTDYLLGRIDDDLLSVQKRMKDNNISGFFDLDLDGYNKLSTEEKKTLIKQMNAMINICLEDKDK